MRVWFKLAFKSIQVFILFIGCTILFYFGLMWINEEYESNHRYDEPQGTALKVSATAKDTDIHWLDRLILFYLNGE